MEDFSDEEISYKEDASGIKRKVVERKCEFCGEIFKAQLSKVREGNGKFCSISCANRQNGQNRFISNAIEGKRKAESLEWSSKLAYLVGLIASDGSLRSGHPRVTFYSKDSEQIKNFEKIIDDSIREEPGGVSVGEDGVKHITITSRQLYYFLRDIGIHPNKSFTIGKIDIPNRYFADFVRGEIDGDGGFYWIRDKKFISTCITSGSKEFLKYLKNRINKIITKNNQGSIYHDDDFFRLQFSLFDTLSIYNSIYNNAEYYLSRKWKIPKEFFDKYGHSQEELRNR